MRGRDPRQPLPPQTVPSKWGTGVSAGGGGAEGKGKSRSCSPAPPPRARLALVREKTPPQLSYSRFPQRPWDPSRPCKGSSQSRGRAFRSQSKTPHFFLRGSRRGVALAGVLQATLVSVPPRD